MTLTRSWIACIRVASVRLTSVRLAPTQRPTFNDRPLPARSLHAFSPSAPLLKKKSKQAAVSEFEADEFEEDVIEDFDEPSPTSSSSSSSDANDYASTHAHLSERLELPHYAFKSNTPSYRSLRALLQHTARDDRSRTLELVKRWRQRNLPHPDERTSTLFVRTWTQMSEVEEMVDVLSQRDVYGFSSVPARELAAAMEKLTNVEGEVADVKSLLPRLEKARMLVDLIKLEGERDVVSFVAALAFALQLNAAGGAKGLDKTLEALLEEAKGLSEEDAVKSFEALPGKKLRGWATGQVEACKLRVSEPQDRVFFDKLLSRVQ